MERIEHAGLTQTDLVGRRIDGLEVTLLPARAYETRHVTERPRLGVAIEMQRGVDAIASDRVRPFFARPYTLSWLPAGCDVYSRSAAGGEYLMVEGDIRGARPEPCTDLAVDGVREAARAARRWLLADRPDEDALPAALRRLIGFVANDGSPVEHAVGEPSSGRQSLDARRLRHVLELIESTLSEPLAVGALAASVELSSGYFARAFTRTVGCTPHRYVMERRLERARRTLDRGEATLADVALACGFSSHAHLTRAFRAEYGLPPSAARRSRLRPREGRRRARS